MPPKVSVCVVTYNQEKYLRQCLQSIVDQQVNAEVEIIVSDDCSTDKTRDIIEEFHQAYPSKIKPIYLEKNIGAYENFIRTHNLATGEYVCHCDGDDYFLAGKLQAQVDVLEADKDCTAVWHRVDFFDDAGHFVSGETADLTPYKNGIVTFEKAISLGFVSAHSSFMYRRSAPKFPLISGTKIIDLFRTWDVLSSGHGRILSAVLGRYRVAATGSILFNAQDTIRHLAIQHARFFYQQYPELRKYFFIFAVSKFLSDAIHLRFTAWECLTFAMHCFSWVTPLKIINNLRDMRRIQVDWRK